MIKIEELSYNDEVILTIGLNEKDKSVVLADNNSNIIKLGPAGISFESNRPINVSSKNNIAVEGLGIAITARNSLKAHGSASAEFSASGQTSIKGSMVTIN